MRSGEGAAKSINGRVASATVAAIAALDGPQRQERAYGLVAGKAGVPRREAKKSKEMNRERDEHKRIAEAYAPALLDKHGQTIARDYLIELDKTVRAKWLAEHPEVGKRDPLPEELRPLIRTESVHSAEAFLMAVKKARSFWKRTPLYPTQ